MNLQKYRQLQHQLEDAEERADLAENSLAKIRARARGGGSGLMVRVCMSIDSFTQYHSCSHRVRPPSCAVPLWCAVVIRRRQQSDAKFINCDHKPSLSTTI